MNECKGCNSELNSTDDLIVLEGNRVCPYCFYIYDDNQEIDTLEKDIDSFESLLDKVMAKSVKDNPMRNTILLLIFSIISSCIIIFSFLY